MEENAPSGSVKRIIFPWIDEGLLASEERIRHIDIIHTVKKKNALHIWCTYSESRDVRTYIQCRLCGSGILKVIWELPDYCWRIFVFYTFVIAKNVVSLCLLQPQGFLKAFVMEIWRNFSASVGHFSLKFFDIETVVISIFISFCVRPMLIVWHKNAVCSRTLYFWLSFLARLQASSLRTYALASPCLPVPSVHNWEVEDGWRFSGAFISGGGRTVTNICACLPCWSEWNKKTDAVRGQYTNFWARMERTMGQALSQAVSHRPSTAEAWVQFQASCVGFMVDEVALGEDFLRVFWCSLVVTLPPVHCLMC